MINVFYNDAQTVETDSYSPSPKKPALVVDAWCKNYADSVKINTFEPVDQQAIKLVHSNRYVDGVFNGAISNGFGTNDLGVANSLLHTNGSMLAAALNALQTGIAVSPTSGFHHAGYNGGGGFCTFNGLMLVAKYLYANGLVKRVGIVDCDYHYGNGTDNIISTLQIKYVDHFTAGKTYHGVYEGGLGWADYVDTMDSYDLDFSKQSNAAIAARFLNMLPTVLTKMRKCDIILYQAGADPHIADPLGGFLTDAELRQRDRIVFTKIKEIGVPLVWNLAGGYQTPIQKVLDIHNATMEECLKIYG